MSHPGYETKDGFNCCGNTFERGCTETTHETAEWPDPKAKLYFYPKAVKNPGIDNAIKGKNKKSDSEFSSQQIEAFFRGRQMARSFYFVETEEYQRAVDRIREINEKLDEDKNKVRHCLRWGCNKDYKLENNKSASCKHHPGVWDHGHTGKDIRDFISERNSGKNTSVLWNPHWSCCGEDWDSEGCSFNYHTGPTKEVWEEKEAKYIWPDVRAKVYFRKTITKKWKQFIANFSVSETKTISMIKERFEEGVFH